MSVYGGYDDSKRLMSVRYNGIRHSRYDPVNVRSCGGLKPAATPLKVLRKPSPIVRVQHGNSTKGLSTRTFVADVDHYSD